MCGKRLKRLFILSLLLVLLVGSVGAWSFDFSKDAQQTQLVSKAMYEGQSAPATQDFINSLEASLATLKQQLTERERLLTNLQKEIARLDALLTTQRALSTVLQAELDSAVAQSAEYYTALVAAQKKVQPTWGGFLGTSATYALDTADIGAALDVGVRYKSTLLTFGMDITPADWMDPAGYLAGARFKTGLAWSF